MSKFKIRHFNLFILIFLIFKTIKTDVIDPLSSHNLGTASRTIKNQTSDNVLGPCHVCRYSSKSFLNVYKFLGRKKVKEGLAYWDANNLVFNDPKFDFLPEIKNQLCSDLKVGKNECLNLFKIHDSIINDWWKTKRNSVDLLQYLCIEKLSICCPDGHYGNSCKPCPGAPYNVCSRRGVCKGDGTKKGSGKCKCNKSYAGELCDKCDVGYYSEVDENSKNKNEKSGEQKISCLKCDKSCALHCRGKGPINCEVCKKGYVWENEYGCVDIDECTELKKNPCSNNTFCVNTEGSYFCYQCDKACDGCNGDGPDMCLKCAKDHELEGKVCVNKKPNPLDNQMEMTRYATYCGLCIATCIIFRNNMNVAYLIGCIVASYIGIAEYTIGGNDFVNILKNFLR